MDFRDSLNEVNKRKIPRNVVRCLNLSCVGVFGIVQ
jgi:hypothetical protein